MRTHYCGEVNASHIDQVVTLCGWNHRRRDHGGVIFIDLRDRQGLAQVVCDPDRPEMFKIAESVRNEYVLKVTGKVRRRPAGTENPNLASGEVDVVFDAVGGLSPLFPGSFNDVDFCLKLHSAGYRQVWTPHTELYHFESASRDPTVTDEEHAALRELLDVGLTDCFRAREPGGGHYSWYDYRTGGFARHEGLRIDLVLASASLAARCSAVVHDDVPRGWDTPSDHVPVVATFEPAAS